MFHRPSLRYNIDRHQNIETFKVTMSRFCTSRKRLAQIFQDCRV